MKKIKNTLLIAACAASLLGVMTGCATSPLLSKDPTERKQAVAAINDDKQLFFIAMNMEVGIAGQWPDFYDNTNIHKGEYPDDVRVAAVKRLNDMGYLLRCASWRDGDIYIDPGDENGTLEYDGKKHYTKSGCLREHVSPGDTVRLAAAERLSEFEALKGAAKSLDRSVIPESYSKTSRGGYANGNEYFDIYGHICPGNPIDKVMLAAMQKQKQPEAAVAFIYNAAEGGQGIAAETFMYAMSHLDGITPKVASSLFRKVFVDNKNMYTKEEWAYSLFQYVDSPEAEMVKVALQYMPDEKTDEIVAKVKSPEVAKELLGVQPGYVEGELVIRDAVVEDSDQVAMLLECFDAETACEISRLMVSRLDAYKWSNNWISPLVAVATAAASAQDETLAADLSLIVLKKVSSLKKECDDSWTIGWNKSADERASKLAAKLQVNRLSAESLNKIILSCGVASQYVLPSISPEMARNLLLLGGEKSDDLEVRLVGRIPAEQLDIDVYHAVKSAKGKQSVLDAMPEEQKKLAANEQAKDIEAILAKAKDAANTTMCLGGFYLGMDYEDAKTLFVYYFPDMKIEERKVDNCNCFYCGQGDAFCFANKDDKIYEFNFGRKILTKWFKYDAARYGDWARAFSRDNGVELKLDFLNRDDNITVFTGLSSGGSPNYERVNTTLHQTIWTYKSAAKHYRLTYFDEPEIHAFGGGQFGEAAAEDKYKYISATAGTLRAVIENK